MKKISIVLLGMTLLSGVAFAGAATEADQKWLAVVEKMVEQGKTQVSTSSQERVELAKNWAAGKGFRTEVKKTDQGYQVSFSKSLAAK